MDSISIKKCQVGTTKEKILEKTSLLKKNVLKISDDDIIVLKIKYVIIPLSDEGNINIANIQANHNTLNKHYQSFQDTNELPSNSIRYPYKSILGDPKIAFYPFDSSQVTEENKHVIRLKAPDVIPEGYTDASETEREFIKQGGVIEDGVIYIYISTLLSSDKSSTLLGAAKDIVSNSCIIHYKTVGSVDVPGTLTNYAFGKTLLHELGHCFGLFHPFPDSNVSCDDEVVNLTYSLNPQGVKQINPNEFASFDTISTDDNALDNRGRDLLRFCIDGKNCSFSNNFTTGVNPSFNPQNPTPYSCMTKDELSDPTTKFETFMIFMDYGTDKVMLGFPTYHIDTMRSTILNHSDSLFSIATVSPQSLPLSNLTLSDLSFSSAVSSSSASTVFPVWLIIVIVIGSVLFIAGLIFVIYFINKKKSKPNNFLSNKNS